MSNPFEDLKTKAKKKKKTKTKKTQTKEEPDKKDTKHNTSNNTQHNTNNQITLNKNTTVKKVRRNFYINEKIDKRLNNLSKQSNKSKSELVEIALDNLIENVHIE